MLDKQEVIAMKLELAHAAEFLTMCFESTERADKTLILGLARALSEICERIDDPPSSPKREFHSTKEAIAETEVWLDSFQQSTVRWGELGQDRGVHIENLLKIRSAHDEN